MLSYRAAGTAAIPIRPTPLHCAAFHSSGSLLRRFTTNHIPAPPLSPFSRAKQPASSAASSFSNAPPAGAAGVEQMLEQAMGDEDFVEMMLRGRAGQNTTWKTVTIRPVLLRSKRQLQFSFFDGKQTLVKNFLPEDAVVELPKLLDLMSCSSILLRSVDEEVNVQVSRKGKPIIHRTSIPRPSGLPQAPGGGPLGDGDARLQHDRTKQLPISPNEPHAFLKALGMQTADGRIKADMQDKFTQVNEFLKLLGHTGAVERWAQQAGAAPQAPLQTRGRVQVPDLMVGGDGDTPSSSGDGAGGRPVCILDCGCGSSHLTFGTFHYLNNVLRVPARIMGIDTNAALMQRSNVHCRGLGLDEEQAQFFTSPILQFTPEMPVPPDVVLALHACDTATDEAIALGIKKGATVIMAVPCCHKHLHRQMAKLEMPASFRPLMRHGIMKQRQIDMLTDTFRAQLLRTLGYKTDAVEFTSAEHTPRNLLLRAVRIPDQEDKVVREMVQEYEELKAFWGGPKPHLEVLLRPEFEALRSRLGMTEATD